ncbi:hypothetical protein RND81_07G200800 [Saponaria officinalis]|uniref:Uncharacterized protein n=1 Tax=Saponaria officinalis TaxID=3572 RepID=A0AAW1JS68_SAPOF
MGQRNKFYHVMRTGLLYRGKGVNFPSPEDCLLDNPRDDEAEEHSETEGDECEAEDGSWEEEDSDISEHSDSN